MGLAYYSSKVLVGRSVIENLIGRTTMWQEVNGKAAQELYPGEGHQFLIGIIGVIPEGKGHSTFVNIFDTWIANLEKKQLDSKSRN